MQRLNLPTYSFNLKSEEGTEYIFDESRQKWLVVTPEEWVRQHLLKYFVEELNYPVSLIATEMSLGILGSKRRCDIVVFDRSGAPVLITECKAPQIKLGQKTFDQVAAYNFNMKVPFLIISNGLQHHCALLDHEKNSFEFLKSFPNYDDLCRKSAPKS